MKLEQIMLSAKKADEYFQRFQLSEKVLLGGVVLLVAVVVLSHITEVAIIFAVALYGGGWATNLVTRGRDNVLINSRQLLPFLPDLVGRFKVKRKQAGLSTLPDFEAGLERYSVNGCKFNKSRPIRMTKVKVCQEENAATNSGLKSSNGQCLDLPSITLPVTVDEELQHLIKSIMHDFVLSWYSVHVSDHEQVSEELLKHLLSISENLSTRLESMSKRNLVTRILVEFRTHVYRFQRARSSLRKLRSGRTFDSSSLVTSYETFSLMHPAIEDTTTEKDYLKGVMRVLLHSAVPKTVTQCQASTAILVEILTCNLLLPLLNLLADPDFLYRLILLIVSSAVSLSENIEALENDSADKLKPKKTATSSSQRSVLHQENIETSCISHTDRSLTCLTVSASSGESESHQSQTQQKSTTVHEIFEPRCVQKSIFQFDESHGYPLLQHKESPSFQLKSKDPNLAKVLSGASIPSSGVPISRSMDALTVDFYPARRHGNDSNDSLPPGCFVTASSRGRRRSASDSSLNLALGAFIPGDLNPVEWPSLPGDLNPAEEPSIPRDTCRNLYYGPVGGPSVPGIMNPIDGPSIPEVMIPELSEKLCMARPAKKGAEKTDDKVVIPMTALEPVMTTAPICERPDTCYDRRPRSWSGDSFSSIEYDISQLNMPFTDIDYQFAFEGSRRLHRAAAKVVNSCVVREPEIKQTNEIARGIDQTDEENKVYKASGLGTRVVEDNKCVESDVMLQPEGTLKQTSQAKIMSDCNQQHDTVKTTLVVGQQVTPAISVAHSSPIKKLLRRVSFSKKSKSGPQRLEGTASKKPPVPTGRPVSIPIPVQLSRPIPSPSEQNNSPPTLPQINSTVNVSDNTQIPTAEIPRVISVSAPETSSESESMLSFVDGLVQRRVVDLVIPKAEVCKEMGGKGEFFLYSIQFDVLPSSSASSSTESLQECESRPVGRTTKRRHREFVNLHSRLEHNPQLKHSLKGIQDIPKRLSIPLAPTAKTAIDQRRVGHQHYLRQLLARPLLHACAELAEFLALEGDTHIEYVRHQPREYVPRIDKLLFNRVSGLVDTFKSAIPRALSDLGPLPPTSPTRRFKPSQDAGKKMCSPPGSPKPGSPSSIGEHDGRSDQARTFTFDRRPKTTLQLAMDTIIQDHSCKTVANSALPAHPTAATNPLDNYVLGPRSDGDGCESLDTAVSETQPDGKESSTVLGSEEVALFDSVMCLLGEAFHDKEPWFLDEGFQSVVTTLAGGLLDGWIEKQVNLLLSEHWCAFYLAELREVLWPDGKLLSASEDGSARSETEKEATRKEALTRLVDLMPETFYNVVNKQDWQDGLELLLESLGDPQLNRHLMFTALDLLMDALIAEIKDEIYQKELLSRI